MTLLFDPVPFDSVRKKKCLLIYMFMNRKREALHKVAVWDQIHAMPSHTVPHNGFTIHWIRPQTKVWAEKIISMGKYLCVQITSCLFNVIYNLCRSTLLMSVKTKGFNIFSKNVPKMFEVTAVVVFFPRTARIPPVGERKTLVWMTSCFGLEINKRPCNRSS